MAVVVQMRQVVAQQMNPRQNLLQVVMEAVTAVAMTGAAMAVAKQANVKHLSLTHQPLKSR